MWHGLILAIHLAFLASLDLCLQFGDFVSLRFTLRFELVYRRGKSLAFAIKLDLLLVELASQSYQLLRDLCVLDLERLAASSARLLSPLLSFGAGHGSFTRIDKGGCHHHPDQN